MMRINRQTVILSAHIRCLPVRVLPFSKERPSLLLISTEFPEFPLFDLDLFARMIELRNDLPAVILLG